MEFQIVLSLLKELIFLDSLTHIHSSASQKLPFIKYEIQFTDKQM